MTGKTEWGLSSSDMKKAGLSVDMPVATEGKHKHLKHRYDTTMMKKSAYEKPMAMTTKSMVKHNLGEVSLANVQSSGMPKAEMPTVELVKTSKKPILGHR